MIFPFSVEDEHSGTIAVIATRLTLREEKFQRLLERYREKGEIINVPAAGLADLVEQGHYADDTGRAFLRRLFDGVTPDTIVLGCTHYLFTEESPSGTGGIRHEKQRRRQSVSHCQRRRFSTPV